jgi:hypothetical protein
MLGATPGMALGVTVGSMLGMALGVMLVLVLVLVLGRALGVALHLALGAALHVAVGFHDSARAWRPSRFIIFLPDFSSCVPLEPPNSSTGTGAAGTVPTPSGRSTLTPPIRGVATGRATPP